LKKFLAILAGVAVLGGGATAAVLLSNNADKFETTAVVSNFQNVTLEYAPDNTYGGSVQVRWGSALFAQSSNIYNHDLALLAGALSAAAYDGNKANGEYIADAYKKLLFDQKNITLYSYPDHALSVTKIGSSRKDNKYYDDGKTLDGPAFADNRFRDKGFAFSIASKDMGGWSLIAIVLRGTAGGRDGASDININPVPFLNVEAPAGFNEFYEEVALGLEEYLGRHTGLLKENTKVLVTGHSLGGVSANLFAAAFNDTSFIQRWNGKLRRENVYAYTVAAPRAYRGKPEGNFDNIFNIVNEADYAPNWPDNKGSSLFAWFDNEGWSNGKRFGHEKKFTDGDKSLQNLNVLDVFGFQYHAQQLYVRNIQNMRSGDDRVRALESSVAAAQEADRLAREGESRRAAEEVSRAEAESRRQVEEAAAQRADDEIKAKLTKLAEDANASAAWGSLFSFGTLEMQVCAFGESRQKYGLIYKYQYTYNVVDVETEKRNLQSTVNLQNAMLQGSLNTLKNEGIPNATVRVQYLNRDGSMIYEQEFR